MLRLDAMGQRLGDGKVGRERSSLSPQGVHDHHFGQQR